jgi:hypothetical protein
VTPDRLGLRALNRAALHRQLLLDRAALTALQAVGHLAGLQAQAPLAPYVGLWTRLAGFRHQELKDLISERAVVRAHLMRNTVHLVDAGDFVRFRPLFQALLGRALAANFARNLVGVDLAELAAAAAALLGETALTRVELGARLAPRWPERDPASLAYAASHLLPLVQVPPRGLWGEPTTCCSPTPNAAGSSRTAARSRCRPATAGPGARCSSTACGRPTGRSSRASSK